MKTIFKYEIDLMTDDTFTIKTFEAAELLDIQIQHEKVAAWVYCDDENKSQGKEFNLKFTGTGKEFRERSNYKYLRTLQMMGGKLVLHAFVLKKDVE